MTAKPNDGIEQRSRTLAAVLALLAALLAMTVVPLAGANSIGRTDPVFGANSIMRVPDPCSFGVNEFPFMSIGRANLDGTDAKQSFITVTTGGDVAPPGVAVDEGHVYWSNLCTNTIGRANLDGSGAEQSFITGAYGRLAVDAQHIYWTTSTYDQATASYESAIARANLDGTNVEPSFITPTAPDGGYPSGGLAVDAQHVYWTNIWPGPTDRGTIGRADLDGTNIDPSFITVDRPVSGVAVDAEHVYWTVLGHGIIGRADLDGTGVDQSLITAPPSGSPDFWYAQGPIAVDASHLYWANGLPGKAPYATIARANLDGTDVEPSFLIASAEAIAVDAAHIYWTNYPDAIPPETTITKGAPNKTAKTSIRFRFSSDEAGSTFEYRLDKKRWKPCASQKKVKHLDHGKHKFKVRATDVAGNVDPTPAKDKFKVLG